ncbi:Beta-1,4-N-acetylgalactosaminyltransferase 3 [Trichoplax sp. H2]|nr:Beta-1,4-N-acetylgalactosaminyltransferase 3 [Trichoplax sp. H2]|eukprot:RDD45572.1 Beta-1,4-N-acetylgalactosaminyltransferase 3 [Trichoplax sp. H2]
MQLLINNFNQTNLGALRIKSKIGSISCHCKGQTPKDFDGKLCLYQWINHNRCLEHIDDLKEAKTFPFQPLHCRSVDRLQVDQSPVNVGNRIVGFIHPPFNALYTFELVSKSSCELWLSRDNTSRNIFRIAHTFLGSQRMNLRIKLPTKSPWIYMEKGRQYWIELLQVTGNTKSFLAVKWKYYDGKIEKNLGVISHRHISLLQEDDIANSVAQKQASHHVEGWKIDWKSFHLPYQINYQLNRIVQFYHLQRFVISDDIIHSSSLQYCHNRLPNYLLTTRNRFQQVMAVAYRVFGDEFRSYISPVRGKIELIPALAQGAAKSVVQDIFTRYQSYYNQIGKPLTLLQTIRVEEKLDPSAGSRYFIELKVAQGSQHYQLSEYFYKNKTNHQWCYDADFQWSNTAPVNMIMMINHDHKYSLVLRAVLEIEKWYAQSLDSDHFTLTIIDKGFTSTPKIKAKLQKSRLKKKYFWIDDTAQSSDIISPLKQVLQQPINLTNSILFYFDPAVHFSSQLMQEIRKKTIEGRQCFAPLVINLNCGFNFQRPDGYVDRDYYNVLSCYISDYQGIIHQDKPVKAFAMLLRKLIENELDIERTSYPLLFRQYRHD